MSSNKTSTTLPLLVGIIISSLIRKVSFLSTFISVISIFLLINCISSGPSTITPVSSSYSSSTATSRLTTDFILSFLELISPADKSSKSHLTIGSSPAQLSSILIISSNGICPEILCICL